MDDKYLNMYRIPSNRLKGWDYSNNGIYFKTICTGNRECFFGEIINQEMQLNEMGKLAEKCCKDIPKQFSYMKLGEFIVMPNHIYGLLTVETQFIASSEKQEIHSQQDVTANSQDAINCVSTTGGFAGNKNPLLNQNISRVIRWFKGRCCFELRKIHADFAWQTRFYDHIVRNENSLKRIEFYIQNNPQNWNEIDE